MTDSQTEARLAREAQHQIGVLVHPDVSYAGQGSYVEVSYQVAEDELERAGRFAVTVPLGCDPYEVSYELALAELQRRYPDAVYLSIDDIYSR